MPAKGSKPNCQAKMSIQCAQQKNLKIGLKNMSKKITHFKACFIIYIHYFINNNLQNIRFIYHQNIINTLSFILITEHFKFARYILQFTNEDCIILNISMSLRFLVPFNLNEFKRHSPNNTLTPSVTTYPSYILKIFHIKYKPFPFWK